MTFLSDRLARYSLFGLGVVGALLTASGRTQHDTRLSTMASGARPIRAVVPPLDSDSIVVVNGNSVALGRQRDLATLRLRLNPRALATGTRTRRAGVQSLDSLIGDSLGKTFIYVPPQCVGTRRCPLLILLHGLGMDGKSMIELNQGGLQALADSTGIILLTPSAYDGTWTPPYWTRQGSSTPSQGVHRIEVVFRYVLQHYAIDPTRIALGGGSNGGGMALVVGLANGDIFTRVLGFSPSISGQIPLWVFHYHTGIIVASIPRRGKPLIFMQQGDTLGKAMMGVSDINSHMLAEELRQEGYTVMYTADAGVHGMPQERASAGFHWLAASWSGGNQKSRGTSMSPPHPAGHP